MSTPKTLAKFPCPRCGDYRSTVTNSRPTIQGEVKRTRACVSCHYHFATVEKSVTDLDVEHQFEPTDLRMVSA